MLSLFSIEAKEAADFGKKEGREKNQFLEMETTYSIAEGVEIETRKSLGEEVEEEGFWMRI
jgi:hypothetical protein